MVSPAEQPAQPQGEPVREQNEAQHNNDEPGPNQDDIEGDPDPYDPYLNRWVILHTAILIPIIITVCFFIVDVFVRQNERQLIEGTMERHLYDMVCVNSSFGTSPLCLRLEELLRGVTPQPIVMHYQ